MNEDRLPDFINELRSLVKSHDQFKDDVSDEQKTIANVSEHNWDCFYRPSSGKPDPFSKTLRLIDNYLERIASMNRHIADVLASHGQTIRHLHAQNDQRVAPLVEIVGHVEHAERWGKVILQNAKAAQAELLGLTNCLAKVENIIMSSIKRQVPKGEEISLGHLRHLYDEAKQEYTRNKCKSMTESIDMDLFGCSPLLRQIKMKMQIAIKNHEYIYTDSETTATDSVPYGSTRARNPRHKINPYPSQKREKGRSGGNNAKHGQPVPDWLSKARLVGALRGIVCPPPQDLS